MKGSPKDKKRKTVYEFEPTVERVRDLMRSAGSQMASVHFIKKNGELRKMAYRVGVRNPSCAAPVKGKVDWQKRKASQKKTKTMTVLDANKVVRDDAGNPVGRGAWRSVPLDRVIQVTVRGVTHQIYQKV